MKHCVVLETTTGSIAQDTRRQRIQTTPCVVSVEECAGLCEATSGGVYGPPVGLVQRRGWLITTVGAIIGRPTVSLASNLARGVLVGSMRLHHALVIAQLLGSCLLSV
jgi:hypothetical protein